ncbi:iron-siderophore ABC transporter substrate-binding protein [Ilumatobacter nonamiensis]|uniref:iron-siderophore ABC transporter substrate-binding protein n=1 Tax=Ilumatobacter nonamiensis TaxID=467093 RepID=UPI0003483EA4|nr:iron-siderophore ABC transporter substrate-binding protein [Ilumatobacter nonamiensis]
MTPARRVLAVSAAASIALAVSACGSDDASSDDVAESASSDAPATDDTTADDTADGEESETSEDAASDDGAEWTPITIETALGTATIEEQPERVATVNWANHEVPLALGVVPVGMAAANFGDDDGDGLLPWVTEELEELGAETPVLFDETDGIDFEAVADTDPDVILAAYSGLTQEDFDTLSEIAPVVAYPEAAWATPWREIIELNSEAMGMAEEGDALIAELEQQIEDSVAEYPQIEGKSAMFAGHLDPTDLSEVGFYTSLDTRVQFFEDLGLEIADVVAEASEGTDQFSMSQSTEQIQVFDEVDIIVGYGDENGELIGALQADPLASKIPALERGSVVFFNGSTPLATAANPTPLSLSWVLDDYVAMLAEAADQVE